MALHDQETTAVARVNSAMTFCPEATNAATIRMDFRDDAAGFDKARNFSCQRPAVLDPTATALDFYICNLRIFAASRTEMHLGSLSAAKPLMASSKHMPLQLHSTWSRSCAGLWLLKI